jgi:serine/threonine-protein kinase
MTSGPSEQWIRVEEILNGALDRQPDERAAFIESACCGDEALQREVGSLLDAHDRPGALERLAPHVTPLTARLHDVEPGPGGMIGPYALVERIGGGGMGIVYRALDTRADRSVALKLMQPRFTEDATAVKRFRLEASLVATLDHPNICTVHEVGETADGRMYLVMPLYEGETLRQRLASGPLAVNDAIGIAVQVTRGLAKAHDQGIVHRDIKPSNIFISADGTVTLLDFGIAKLAGVTLTGSLAGPLGTIAYMSPEQLRGDPLDHRTDLWSLGVVLHEMLAGQRPFGRGAVGVVVNAIVHAEPAPLATHRPDVAPALGDVVRTALAKSRDARFASARAFEAALLAAGAGAA